MAPKTAQNLYWLQRRVEKSFFMLRLLSVQLMQLPQDTSQTLAVGWNWILNSFNMKAPAGSLLREHAAETDDFCQADAYTLIDHLTFEKGEPQSILNNFQSAQKKAQEAETASAAAPHIDAICSLLEKTKMPEIWPQEKTLAFYKKLISSIYLLYGLLDKDFYRGESFYFMQLGRFVEILERIISILKVHEQYIIGWKDVKKELMNLLLYCGAFDFYKKTYNSNMEIQKVFDFIVSHPQSPYSLRFSITKIDESVQHLPPPSPQLKDIILSLASQASSPKKTALKPFLEEIQTKSLKLQNELNAVYFNGAQLQRSFSGG